MFDTDFGY